MGRRKKRDVVYLVVRRCDRKEPPHDYLKFYKVVRYWAKRKHGLTSPQIDMLLFLRSEYLFTRTAFNEYHNIFSWNSQEFDNLLRDGWIRQFRKSAGAKHSLYELSGKAKRVVGEIYKKCNGESDFSTVPNKNPVFRRSDSNFADKTHAIQMKKINKINREKRLGTKKKKMI